MAKIAAYIALVWLTGSFVCSQPACGNGDERGNVAPSDSPGGGGQGGAVCNRSLVVDTLVSYIGVKELTGNNDGPEVEMFIASTGLDAKGGYAWCAAFITYCYKANLLPVPKYPARAASWFPAEKVIQDKDAVEGDLFSLWYRNLGRIGHIGMYLEPYVNPTPYIVSGEGNTNAEGSREGNQAAKRLRPRATIYNSSNWIDN